MSSILRHILSSNSTQSKKSSRRKSETASLSKSKMEDDISNVIDVLTAESTASVARRHSVPESVLRSAGLQYLDTIQEVNIIILF